MRLVYEKRYRQRVWEPKKTIRTFLMPLEEAERLALKVFRLDGSQAPGGVN